jgi:hypothetical protein
MEVAGVDLLLFGGTKSRPLTVLTVFVGIVDEGRVSE